MTDRQIDGRTDRHLATASSALGAIHTRHTVKILVKIFIISGCTNETHGFPYRPVLSSANASDTYLVNRP